MENIGELLAAVVTASGVLGAVLYGAGRQMWKMYTKDKREAEATAKRIAEQNTLRSELSEVYEQIRQQERDYLERKIADLQSQIDKDREDYDAEIKRQQKSIDAISEAYQRLADSAQTDKLTLENHIEQQQQEIETLREKSRQMGETLEKTQTELKQTKEELAEHKIDKVVLERTNALLEQQLDVFRGLVEPMRNWMMREAAA